MNYPYDIPSIAQIHPAFGNAPHILNVQAFQGVYTSNAIGTPLDPHAVEEAENTVQFLSGSRGRLPAIITQSILETARNRVHVLRETHASLDLGLQPGVGQFVQVQFGQFGNQLTHFGNQLAHFGNQLARIEAMHANTRISTRNRRYPSDPLRALQKTIDGEGHQLALAICGHPVLPPPALNFNPNAAIGDVPNPWNAQIDAYQHIDLLQLVIFYNDDFGIVVGDTLPVRKTKLHRWLLDD